MKYMTIEEILIRVKNAMKIGEYNLAEDLLNKIISTKPDFFLPFMLLGNVYEQTGRIDKALQLFKQSIRLKPDNVEAYNNIGVTYKNIGKYKESLAFLNRALLLDPHRADIYYNLGNVYKETGNLDQAIQQYEKSIEINPFFVPAYNNLGTVLETLNKYDVAGQVYNLGLEVDFNNPKLHYNLGIIYEKQNKLKQARLEFEHALRTRPGWSDALLNLGIVLSKLSEHNKSIDAFQSILRIDPENVKAINNLGIEHSKLKNIEKAKSFYNKAISLDPDYEKAHFNLGTLLEDQGEYEQALSEIENLAKKKPDNISTRFRLGNIYTAMGKYKKAEIQFRSILKHNPDHTETLRALGNLYLRTGKYNEANKCYDQLSRTHPDMEDYHLDFAVLLNDKKEFEKSEVEVKKFLSANPDDINAQSLLGELYFKQDLLKNASALFEQIIEKNPHIVKPYYYLAKTYNKMGDTEKAVETIDKLITMQGTRGTHTDIDNLNKTIELYENATKEYERVFKVKLHKNIAHLDDFSYDSTGDIKSREDPDLLYSVDDADTIMKTGGIEPIIPVKEEVEQIKIIESIQEESPPQVVELEDSEPLPYTDLLKNQELYETLPALTAKLLEQKTEQKSEQEDFSKQYKEKKEQGSIKQFKEQKTPPIIKQREEIYSEIPYESLQEKGNKDEESHVKSIDPGLLHSLADKVDSIAEKTKEDKGLILESNDKANETLLDVLKNISRAFKQGIQQGSSPAYYFPLRRKRRTRRNRRKKKQEALKKESLDEYLENKAKTTREKLKEFFGNVRKKLDEEPEIKIPKDKKKQEYIQKLVNKISESNPFKDHHIKTTIGAQQKTNVEHSIKYPAVDKKSNKKSRLITDIIKKLKKGYKGEMTKDQDVKNKEKGDITDKFITHGTARKEEMNLQNELVLEQEFVQDKLKKEYKDLKKQTDTENKWDEQFEPQKLIKTDTFQEKEVEKSFKPRIRLEKKSFSKTIIIKTLQFFRKLLGFVLKAGIKTRFDNFIEKLKKK